jgi:hypothetical protein
MAYVAVESLVETALKTAFATAVTAAKLTAYYRRFWVNDAGNTGEPDATREEVVYPIVGIAAAPNYPSGWHTTERTVPVTVSLITYATDDPNRATLLSLYNAVRGSIDADTFTATGICDITALPVPGGAIYSDERLHVAEIMLDVSVCVT